ncbi:MAG: di-heme oxidoredictase family protein [Pseudomonadota bacterium]
MPRIYAFSTILAVLLAAPSSFAADTSVQDLHLEIVPRTASELERIAGVIQPTTDFTQAEKFERNAAGAATVPNSAHPFSQPSGNISFEREFEFRLGEAMFEKLWVASPSSTLASDGLGPLFNARACSRCHLNDGRGHPPKGPDDRAVSMLLRVGVPAEAGQGGMAMEPVYGAQLQDMSVPGIDPEYRLGITYEEIDVELSDGESATLRKPTYSAGALAYGALNPKAVLSPRIAPQMIGLGLLEAIPAEDILALADPQDADGDGISGRAHIVWSQVHQTPMLGRFGLKAGLPTLLEQSSTAFFHDIGISTPLHTAAWGDCTAEQDNCRTARHGDGDVRVHEIDLQALEIVEFYSRNLGVPARRDVDDPDVLRGKQMFYESGCVACHTPKFVTHRLENQPEQSFQLIWPYTDLLLHDMGEGLADGFAEGNATGREWRTPPLWGIGLTQKVSGHTYLLHDGRARSLLEAVLWHGGEAQASRDAVVDMPKTDRDALLKFLESL